LKAIPCVVLTCLLAAAGGACLAADAAPDAAPLPLDPYSTTLPIYLLPDSAAADGDLSEWGNVPPSVRPDQIRHAGSKELIEPSDDFAPMLYCGRCKDSPDLYFLLIVKDQARWSVEGGWAEGDYSELYLDFGRAARQAANPKWYEDKNLRTPPEMGQLGLRAGTLTARARAFTAAGFKNAKWGFDYAYVPVEGGHAYEVRIDGASVLQQLKLEALPPVVGLDLGPTDQDYPIVFKSGGWENRKGHHRIFSDGMAHASPARYGMLSTEPQPVPKDAKPPALPATLPALYGEFPAEDELRKGLAELPDRKLADLVYWAGLQGAALSTDLVKEVLAARAPHAHEALLAVMLYTDQEADAVRAAVDHAYRTDVVQTPLGLVLANLLNEKLKLGYVEQLRALILHEDLTVAFTAARALAKVGSADDAAYMAASLDAILAEYDKRTGAGDKAAARERRACVSYFGAALDELLARTVPIPVPKSFSHREVKKENTAVPRHMPLDNNNVYNAVSLLRSWPDGGPKELWRVEVGGGFSAVVSAGGRSFVVATQDKKTYAICIDAAGKEAWKVEVGGSANNTPVADGDRLYVTTDQVKCLNAADGSVVWTAEGVKAAQYTAALIVGDVLYVGAAAPGALVALDKSTGKKLWHAAPGLHCACASPAYQEIEGIGQVIFGAGKGYNDPEVWGVNAKTGEVFWQRPFDVQWGLTSSPVAYDYRVLLCSGHGPRLSQCLQMYAEMGAIKARLAYRVDGMQTNSHNTPAIIDGYVYGFGQSGLQCSKLEDGSVVWNQRWEENRHLVAADGLLFISTGKGELVMAEATPEGYKELGRVSTGLDLGGSTQQMTISDGRIFVRGKKKVACYDLVNPPQ